MPSIVLNAKDTMVKKIQTWYLLLWSLHSSNNLGIKHRILKSEHLSPYLYIYLNIYEKKKKLSYIVARSALSS